MVVTETKDADGSACFSLSTSPPMRRRPIWMGLVMFLTGLRAKSKVLASEDTRAKSPSVSMSCTSKNASTTVFILERCDSSLPRQESKIVVRMELSELSAARVDGLGAAVAVSWAWAARAGWLNAAAVPGLVRACGSGKSSARTGVSCSTTRVGTAPGPEPAGGFPSILSEPDTSEDEEEASDSLVEVICD